MELFAAVSGGGRKEWDGEGVRVSCGLVTGVAREVRGKAGRWERRCNDRRFELLLFGP